MTNLRDLHTVLDTFHEDRLLSINDLMTQVVDVLEDVVEALLDEGHSLDLVSRCQVLTYICRHVWVPEPGSSVPDEGHLDGGA